jgi:hypothetical protein
VSLRLGFWSLRKRFGLVRQFDTFQKLKKVFINRIPVELVRLVGTIVGDVVGYGYGLMISIEMRFLIPWLCGNWIGIAN